nr:hypothetical protein [Tanacetum cinerariifolium]
MKTVNDEVRVQALIDGMKVTIKESSIRRTLSALVLKPPLGMNLAALWHQQLSALQQTRSLTSSVDHQLGDMSHHKDIYDNPSLTTKVFANMKRVDTGFSRVITPLFESMLVQAVEEVAPKVPSPTPSPEHQLPPPSYDLIPTAKDSLTLHVLMDLCTRLSNKVLDLESEVIDIKSSFTDRIQKLEGRVDQLKEENRVLKDKSFKTTQVAIAAPVEDMEKSFKQERMKVNMDEDAEEVHAKAYNLDLQHAEKVLSMQDTDEEEPAEMEEVLEVVKAAKLMTEVVTNAQPTTNAAQVPKPSAPRRRKGVIIQDPKETATSVIMHSEVQSKDKGKGILIKEPKPLKGQARIKIDEAFTRQLEAELNANINWNDVIEQVKRSEKQDNTVMRYQALKRKPVTKAQARKNMMIYLKNMAGFKMDFFKGMTYSEIRPIFEKHYNSIQAFLEKEDEEVTVQEEGNKRQGKSLKQDITKKQRINEEEEELKRHLQIVANDYDDVEDLEALWKLFKERFEATEPKNFSYDFLINTLKIMFKKPNVEANVWRDQNGIYGLAKVKSWKLFESCEVHVITRTTTQMILLVEKKYPLTHFTLQQMLDNVRLEVEEEGEMSLELLRLVRRQLNEGHVPELSV